MSVKQYLAPGLLCVVLGFSLVLQVRTHAKRAEAIGETRATEEMVAQLVKANHHREQLQEELRYLRDLANREATQSRLLEELYVERAAAGLQALSGPGVVVTMGHTTPSADGSQGVDTVDVLRIFNELRAGGAEAMSINGVRVTERLQLTRAGANGPIMVGSMPLSGPVVIQAIGDPAVLAASLNLRGGIVQELKYFYPITVAPTARVEVPTVTSPPTFRHARTGR